MTAYPLVGFLVFVWSRSKLRGVKNHRCASLMLGNTGGMTIAVVLEHAQDATSAWCIYVHRFTTSENTGGILTCDRIELGQRKLFNEQQLLRVFTREPPRRYGIQRNGVQAVFFRAASGYYV